VSTKAPRYNYIINGDFSVAQYAESQTAQGYGSVDRWRSSYSAGSSMTMGRAINAVADVPRYYYYATVAGNNLSTSYVINHQMIYGLRQFSGKEITLSFSCSATGGNSITAELLSYFGSGGSPSAEVSLGYKKVTAATRTRFEYTLTVPTISGKTLGSNNDDALRLFFWFSGGSDFNSRTGSLPAQTGNFYLEDIKIEIGSVATPFEPKLGNEELSLCQYYYRKGTINAITQTHTINVAVFSGNFSQMAKTPTITISAGTANVPAFNSLYSVLTTPDSYICTYNTTAPANYPGYILNAPYTADTGL
jgi:hypothetical protein